jgi:hypothetical protein
VPGSGMPIKPTFFILAVAIIMQDSLTNPDNCKECCFIPYNREKLCGFWIIADSLTGFKSFFSLSKTFKFYIFNNY